MCVYELLTDFVSLDDFVGDGLDEGVRHRRPGFNRVPPIRRKPEKVTNQHWKSSVYSKMQKSESNTDCSVLICVLFVLDSFSEFRLVSQTKTKKSHIKHSAKGCKDTSNTVQHRMVCCSE